MSLASAHLSPVKLTWHRFILVGIAFLLFSVMVIVLLGALSGPRISHYQNAPLHLMPSDLQIVDFGDVKKGTLAVRQLSIRNNGSIPVLINKFTTSCSCAHVSCQETNLTPNDVMPVILQIDLRNDIGFGGRLIISVVVITAASQYTLLHVEVNVV